MSDETVTQGMRLMNMQATPTSSDRSTARELPTHDARALVDGGQLALITLDEQVYTLRITRQGKLILTK